MKKIAVGQMFFLVFLSGLLATGSVHAQAAKNYFDGKTISFLVGSTAGGGSDLMARLVARILRDIFLARRASTSSTNPAPAV